MDVVVELECMQGTSNLIIILNDLVLRVDAFVVFIFYSELKV
jgi:hypothetical protein